MNLKDAANITAKASIDTSKIDSNIKEEVYYLFGDLIVDNVIYEVDYDTNSNTIQLYDPSHHKHLGEVCPLVFKLEGEDISLEDDEVKKNIPIMLGTAFGFTHPKVRELLADYLLRNKRSNVKNLGEFTSQKVIEIKFECGVEGLIMYSTMSLSIYTNGVKISIDDNEYYLAYLSNTPVSIFVSALVGIIEYLLSMKFSYDKFYVTVKDIMTRDDKPIDEFITKLLEN